MSLFLYDMISKSHMLHTWLKNLCPKWEGNVSIEIDMFDLYILEVFFLFFKTFWEYVITTLIIKGILFYQDVENIFIEKK